MHAKRGFVDPGIHPICLKLTTLPGAQCKIFHHFVFRMLKFAILTVLALPSILAALSLKEMVSALIAAEDSGALEETFTKYEDGQERDNLSFTLVDVAEQDHHGDSCYLS